MTTRRKLVVFVFLSVLLIVAIIMFRRAGRWLIREDPITHADLIVILSGGMPYRAEAAAGLFRAGYAPEIWISRPENPSSELAPMGIHYIGEEDYDRNILVHAGVPATAIHIFPNVIVDTEQEVNEIGGEMRREQKASAIIVTSPPHTRRVRTLWRILVGTNPKAVVRAAWNDPFAADRWWSNTRDSFFVVREILGLMNAWAGFPSRPYRTS